MSEIDRERGRQVVLSAPHALNESQDADRAVALDEPTQETQR